MTANQRALSRKQKIIKTLSVASYAKLVGVLVSFAVVPLAINYLGVEQYGLWVTVSSLIALLSFVDGGAGNALVNMVSHATGNGTEKHIKAIVSSGFFVLLLMAVIGVVVFFFVYDLVPWMWVLGLSGANSNPEDVALLVLIIGLAFFVGMPCSAAGNIQRGFQEGNIEAFWSAKGRLLSLLFVYIAIEMDFGLTGFAFAFVLGPIIASLSNTVYYFTVKKKRVSPSLFCLNVNDVKGVLSTGSLFFVLQITSAIQTQGDNIIIANLLGPSSVSQYAICMQLFMVVPMLMGLLWAPLWPAYREALASGDAKWVRRVFLKSLKLAFFAGLSSAILLVLFGQKAIQLWVGDELIPSVLLLVGCGLWMLLLVVGSATAMLLNAFQMVKTQIIVAGCAGFLNIALSIWLIKNIGLEGAVYGSIISYLVCAVIPYSFLIPSLLRRYSMETKTT